MIDLKPLVAALTDLQGQLGKSCQAPVNPLAPRFRADEDLGVYCYWDVSTAHISRQDDRRLNRHDGLTVYNADCGYWVFVPDDPDELNRLHTDHSYTQEFVNIMNYAREMKIWWIKFDADGKVHSGLPTFAW